MRAEGIRRRSFLALAAAATGWPLAARAQQSPPVVGYLALAPPDAPSGPISAIYVALKQSGYEVGRNLLMEYRYADNRAERLPALAADLARIPVSLIITSGGPASTLAAQAATKTIPIVFAPISDPVRSGIVASLNRPGGNITGIAALTTELDPKRLELLHELTPSKGPLGVLHNPSRPDNASQLDGIRAAARTTGRDVVLAGASTVAQIQDAFAALAQRGVVGLLVAADPFFTSQRAPILALAAQHKWPAIYQWREFVEAGGLASFGASLSDSYRQTGFFAARILKGEKPADLPVQQPTKFEFVINLKAAKALGLTVPIPLLGRADDVIE